MDIENAFNLGLWRGAHRHDGRLRCKRDVPLAPGIDRSTYLAGFDYGRARASERDGERHSGPRPDTHHRPRPDHRPDRRRTWAPSHGRRAA